MASHCRSERVDMRDQIILPNKDFYDRFIEKWAIDSATTHNSWSSTTSPIKQVISSSISKLFNVYRFFDFRDVVQWQIQAFQLK